MSNFTIFNEGQPTERKVYFKDIERTILHREDGPAIEYKSGPKHWFVNGKRHRLDGPAIEYPNSYNAWYKDGLCHREDGAAIEFVNGGKMYWLNDKNYIEEDYWKEISRIKFGAFV